MGGEFEGAPDVGPVNDFGAAGADCAEDGHEQIDAWEHESLPVDASPVAHVAGEIGDVGCHCCPTNSLEMRYTFLEAGRLTNHRIEPRIDS